MPRADRGTRGRTQRKATPGSFKLGPDNRRHRFTQQDCRLGYWITCIKHPHLREWLRMKLRCYYSSKRKEASNGQEEDRGTAGGDDGPAEGDILPFAGAHSG